MIDTACKEERSGWKGTEENVIQPTSQDVDSFFYSTSFDIIYIYISVLHTASAATDPASLTEIC